MRQFILFLLAFFAGLSVTTGASAHAMEPVNCIETSTALTIGHSDGDGDQVPSDANKGFVHHHGGCQGHQIGDTVVEIQIEQHVDEALIASQGQSQFVATAPTDSALRPPIA